MRTTLRCCLSIYNTHTQMCVYRLYTYLCFRSITKRRRIDICINKIHVLAYNYEHCGSPECSTHCDYIKICRSPECSTHCDYIKICNVNSYSPILQTQNHTHARTRTHARTHESYLKYPMSNTHTYIHTYIHTYTFKIHASVSLTILVLQNNETNS